jgi:hypothetical protein
VCDERYLACVGDAVVDCGDKLDRLLAELAEAWHGANGEDIVIWSGERAVALMRLNGTVEPQVVRLDGQLVQEPVG